MSKTATMIALAEKNRALGFDEIALIFVKEKLVNLENEGRDWLRYLINAGKVKGIELTFRPKGRPTGSQNKPKGFDWAKFWAAQPDAPIIKAWAPEVIEETVIEVISTNLTADQKLLVRRAKDAAKKRAKRAELRGDYAEAERIRAEHNL